MISLRHREIGYLMLAGDGLEIGALNEPAPLGSWCSVRYFDAIDERQAAALFPELPAESLVPVDFLGDLDRGGLGQFGDAAFDFVIINHVLEHVANPVKTVRDVFRILRPDGFAIIAVPDKDYTFDRERTPTPFEHLWQDYLDDVTENDDAHYLDFLRGVWPHVFEGPAEDLPVHVARARERREHAHVWTSRTFQQFLEETLRRCGIAAERYYESTGRENAIEYFSAWRKRPGPA